METIPEENGDADENNTKRLFELADVLDYIKTGVEAIIEDQVTSRFEAEELKVRTIVVVLLVIINGDTIRLLEVCRRHQSSAINYSPSCSCLLFEEE